MPYHLVGNNGLRLILLASLILLSGCLSTKDIPTIDSPSPAGYRLLPTPTAGLVLGDRLDPVSLRPITSGCLKGDTRGPFNDASAIRRLGSEKGVDANLTIRNIFSVGFSGAVVKHVELIATGVTTKALINYSADRTTLPCRILKTKDKDSLYLVSTRMAEDISFRFVDVNGATLDLNQPEILKSVFPIFGGVKAAVSEFGMLGMWGKDLVFEIAVNKGLPGNTQTIFCRPDEFCNTDLLPGYQFTVSAAKMGRGQITLSCIDVRQKKVVISLDLKNGEEGYFALPDKSNVIVRVNFDRKNFGKVDIVFTLVG